MRLLILSFLLLQMTNLKAQNTPKPTFGVEYRLDAIHFKEDSLTTNDTIIIRADFDQASDIIPLCTTDSRTYGIQFEVLQSKINDQVQYFVRIAYYYKLKDQWVLIHANTPSPRNLFKYNGTAQDKSKCTYHNPAIQFDLQYCDYFYLN